MSCCTRARLPSRHQTFYDNRSAAGAPMVNGPIVGTWDFKWPEGTQIRVAFQRPTEITNSDFRKVKAIIQSLAQRWHQGQKKLSFSFDVPDFAPPEKDHPQQRTKVTNEPWRLYDVLVSLEPLPLTRRDTIADREERIFLPQSEIGSYARRVDFGTPTMFLGRMPPKPGAPLLSWDAYYKTPLVEHMVVHEFGHALGLAHEHQSPVARRAFKWSMASYDFDKARNILVSHFGVPAAELPAGAPATLGFLEGHLGMPWPGNERFSDWRSYGDEHLETVMAVPYHECALKDCNHPNCQAGCAKITPLQHPTSSDIAAIAAMYS